MDKNSLITKLQARLKEILKSKAECLAQINALSGQAFEVEALITELTKKPEELESKPSHLEVVE